MSSIRIPLAAALAAALLFCGAPAPAQPRRSRDDVKQEVRRLAKQLDHQREHKQLKAIEALGDLGRYSKPVLPRLMKILKQGKPGAQSLAARAVTRIAPKDANVYTALAALCILMNLIALRVELIALLSSSRIVCEVNRQLGAQV